MNEQIKEFKKPKTKFVLIRKPRTDDCGNPITVDLFIKQNDDSFDFSEYSFLRINLHKCLTESNEEIIEEWVPTKELGFYKKAFGVE